MARTPGITSHIKKLAHEVLEQSPEGIRFTELSNRIQAQYEGSNRSTIETTLQTLAGEDGVVRPSRGHWILQRFLDDESKTNAAPLSEVAPPQPLRADEQAYYEPFMEWLKNEGEEVTEVVVVGGNTFKSKWATPDVIGTYKPYRSDPVQFPLELVSAEIKIDASQSVTAFGQACAYRLFSHKVYIVMPVTIENVKDDLERLEALCSLFGMGLVLFKLDPKEPQFSKRVPARRFDPDVFYLNEFARRLLQADTQTFDRLF
jgi:hypothetical protein